MGRHRLGLSLLTGGIEKSKRAWPRRRPSARDVFALHQQGLGSKTRRHDDHHARLSRQFSFDIHFLRRLRAGGAEPSRKVQLRRLLPRIRHRSCRGFEPLRFLPKGNKVVVLGLVTSKSGRLEPRADIKKRLQEATKYIALEQLCLSPQCGFASTEEGNILAEDEQWAKLRMIVELADDVWRKN